MKVRFSDAFLASHRINQRQRVDKECKHIHVLGLVTCLAFKFSPLCLVSSFWLSGHLFLAIQFISEFIWVVRWNGPTCQAKTITVVLPLIPLKIDFPRAKVCDRNTAHANQSASQDCWIATNQHLKSADLQHRRKNKQIKTRPLAFGLGQVKNVSQNAGVFLSNDFRSCSTLLELQFSNPDKIWLFDEHYKVKSSFNTKITNQRYSMFWKCCVYFIKSEIESDTGSKQFSNCNPNCITLTLKKQTLKTTCLR